MKLLSPYHRLTSFANINSNYCQPEFIPCIPLCFLGCILLWLAYLGRGGARQKTAQDAPIKA